tara:strand:- start:17154 stop:17405 length:252 start_codon:yes stop_codon:yes gene_type:complete
MKRAQIIEEVTKDAMTSFEFSCSWSSSVEVIREELVFHGLKPTKPLVLFILKLAKLAWATEVQRVKSLISAEEEARWGEADAR